MNRRDFMKMSALGAAGTMIPSVMQAASAAPKKKSANDKINIAFIGLGQQAMNLLNGFIKLPDVRVVAGCDVYDVKRDRFVRRVNKFYKEKRG